MAKSERRIGNSSKKVNWDLSFDSTNYKIIAAGLLIILIGYGLMWTGNGGEYAAVDGKWNNPMAVTVAPLLLVIGYCVVIPYGILKRTAKKEDNNLDA